MRIRSVPLASIRPGAVLDGPELIFADMGYQMDNMEGLSLHRAADGALVMTIVSDDNFSPLQRTLLLQFTLVGRRNDRAERLSARRGLLLADLALELAHACGANTLVSGAEQIGVEPAAVVDGLQRIGRDPELHLASERVGDHGDVEQVRQKPPLGLDVGMAHRMADQNAFSGEIAAA